MMQAIVNARALLIPTQAASHGCVRVPRYDAQLLYKFGSLRTPVKVIAKSI